MPNENRVNRRPAVRRAAKAFLILLLVVSGGLKLIGDAGMVAVFERAMLPMGILTAVGIAQILCATILLAGIADRAVALALLLLLGVLLIFLAPALSVTLLPLAMVAIACGLVLRIPRADPMVRLTGR